MYVELLQRAHGVADGQLVKIREVLPDAHFR
jgi:hypothetical protein